MEGGKGETGGKKENVAAFFCAASTRRKKMPQHLPEGKSESRQDKAACRYLSV